MIYEPDWKKTVFFRPIGISAVTHGREYEIEKNNNLGIRQILIEHIPALDNDSEYMKVEIALTNKHSLIRLSSTSEFAYIKKSTCHLLDTNIVMHITKENAESLKRFFTFLSRKNYPLFKNVGFELIDFISIQFQENLADLDEINNIINDFFQDYLTEFPSFSTNNNEEEIDLIHLQNNLLDSPLSDFDDSEFLNEQPNKKQKITEESTPFDPINNIAHAPIAQEDEFINLNLKTPEAPIFLSALEPSLASIAQSIKNSFWGTNQNTNDNTNEKMFNQTTSKTCNLM